MGLTILAAAAALVRHLTPGSGPSEQLVANLAAAGLYTWATPGENPTVSPWEVPSPERFPLLPLGLLPWAPPPSTRWGVPQWPVHDAPPCVGGPYSRPLQRSRLALTVQADQDKVLAGLGEDKAGVGGDLGSSALHPITVSFFFF